MTKKPKSNRKPRYLEYVKNVPEEERNEIVDRYRAGEKIFQIAKALKRAPETITAALYMSGQSTPTFIVPNDRKEIIKLFKEGLPYVSIQKRFYLSQPTIEKIAREAGLSRVKESSRVRTNLFEKTYPKLPSRVSKTTETRHTICCLWCGSLERRQITKHKYTTSSFCSMDHYYELCKHTTKNGIEAIRPLILERLVKASEHCQSESALKRVGEECCATKAEIERALEISKWK